jgi:hypothetical protein
MSSEIADKINEYSAEYDLRTYERHEMGEEKYGAGAWLGIDTIEHAIAEVLDLGNYARMTFIKLRMLQDQITSFQSDKSEALPIPGKEMLGKGNIMTGGIPQ